MIANGTIAENKLTPEVQEKLNSGGGGGGNDFVVTYTMNEETSTLTADKTFAEIATAIEAGKNVKAVIPQMNSYLTLSYYVADDEIAFYLIKVYSDSTTFNVSEINHGSNGTIDLRGGDVPIPT